MSTLSRKNQSPRPSPKEPERPKEERATSSTWMPMSITGAPTWFGSLRGFAIATTSSSRGAFTPLGTSTDTIDTLPTSCRNRGRSSSARFGYSMEDSESDDDHSIKSKEEAKRTQNGLKENHLRAPSRTSWAMLDPSLGGIFQTYEAVPTSDSESSSPTSRTPSLSSGSVVSIVDNLAIPSPPSLAQDPFAFSQSTATTEAYAGGGRGKGEGVGPGVWSFRKLAMNFWSGHQYESVSTLEDEPSSGSAGEDNGWPDRVMVPYRDDDNDENEGTLVEERKEKEIGPAESGYYRSFVDNASFAASAAIRNAQAASPILQDQLGLRSSSRNKKGKTD